MCEREREREREKERERECIRVCVCVHVCGLFYSAKRVNVLLYSCLSRRPLERMDPHLTFQMARLPFNTAEGEAKCFTPEEERQGEREKERERREGGEKETDRDRHKELKRQRERQEREREKEREREMCLKSFNLNMYSQVWGDYSQEGV